MGHPIGSSLIPSCTGIRLTRFAILFFVSHLVHVSLACEVPRHLYARYCGKCIYVGKNGLRECEKSNCRSEAPQGFLCLSPDGRPSSGSRLLSKQFACFNWFKREWHSPSYVCKQMGVDPQTSCTGACLETVRVSVMCTHHVLQAILRYQSKRNLTLNSHEFDFSRESLSAYVEYCDSNGYDVSSALEFPCIVDDNDDLAQENILHDYNICRTSKNSQNSNSTLSNPPSSPSLPSNSVSTFSLPSLPGSKCKFPYQLHERFCGRCIYRAKNNTLAVVTNSDTTEVEDGASFCCFDLTGEISCKKGKENNGGVSTPPPVPVPSPAPNDDKDDARTSFNDADVIYLLANLFVPNRKFKSLLCPFLTSGKSKMSSPFDTCSPICIDSLRYVISGIRAVMEQFQLSPNDPLLQFPATCLQDYINYCATLNSTVVRYSLPCNGIASSNHSTLTCPSLLGHPNPTTKSNGGKNEADDTNSPPSTISPTTLASSPSPDGSPTFPASPPLIPAHFFPYSNSSDAGSLKGAGSTLGIVVALIIGSLILLFAFNTFFLRRPQRRAFHLVNTEDDSPEL